MVLLPLKTAATALIFLVFFAHAAFSADAKKNLQNFTLPPQHLLFEVYWGGINAAHFLLSHSQEEGKQKNYFHLEASGLTKLILKLWIKAESDGGFSESGAYRPTLYKVDYENRFRARSVKVDFDPDTGLAAPLITTKDTDPEKDRANEAKVPPKWRRDTIDPIGAVMETIRHTKDHLERGGPKTFSLPVYDGRRRFDILGEVKEVRQREILRKMHKVRRVTLTPQTRAGFKKRHAERWKNSSFDIYLSTDGRYLPLQIVSVGPGPVMNLVKECKTAKACRPES